ncbi:MAG: 2-amino-4-hydroxy-6-hydroxymethyldihydropteridine diphosphokinase [Verrucomicrobia bacterium Tous-C9LFEB]|nr:MAG: 2-amino-4-hydroxy-6-hydroxymethyldihydropteridine diphosphokinase [Verrucomicrobia bacterium Tous-C9LFEB]
MKTGIALGSNLGDRAASMDAGFTFLRSLSQKGYLLQSSVIETDPVDCPPGSGAFFNAVAEIDYEGSPLQLLGQLQNFEHTMGRQPNRAINAPRPLDLDILYFGDTTITTPDLIIPHPRIAQREFVLKPLAEICPNLILPGQAHSVQTLLNHLTSK